MVPNLQSTLLTDKIEKPPDQVYRNYYDYKQVYYPSSKLKQCDWDKYEQNEQKKKFENKGTIILIWHHEVAYQLKSISWDFFF